MTSAGRPATIISGLFAAFGGSNTGQFVRWVNIVLWRIKACAGAFSFTAMTNSAISDDEALWAIRLQIQARLAEVIGEAEMIRQIDALLLASGRPGRGERRLPPPPPAAGPADEGDDLGDAAAARAAGGGFSRRRRR